LSISYAIAPLVGWLVSGSIKSVVSSLKSGRLHLDMLGYGGLPSTHTTIVCTTATLIGLREGVETPEFAVATTVAVLVMMDAVSLRQWVGDQATALNLLRAGDPGLLRLRERVGHKPAEIAAGTVLGILCGFVLSWIG
jgi:acid phosphatase family membrane protein YuiD